jgi:hypothetical protein
VSDWRARADIGHGIEAEPRALPPGSPETGTIDLEMQLLLANVMAALQRVVTNSGRGDRDFLRGLRGVRPHLLSEKQRAHVMRLAWRYRLQLPPGLRPACDPDKLVPAACSA